MGGFTKLLDEIGVQHPERYTSHCFRRGAAVDVLEAHGLKAMLDFGQWHSPQAAEAYASRDEQTAQALAAAVVDFSDEEG